MTYRRPDKVAAYEAATKMIEADSTLLSLPFEVAHNLLIGKVRVSDPALPFKDARQVAGKALRDALHARQVDILAESIGECGKANRE